MDSVKIFETFFSPRAIACITLAYFATLPECILTNAEMERTPTFALMVVEPRACLFFSPVPFFHAHQHLVSCSHPQRRAHLLRQAAVLLTTPLAVGSPVQK